MSSPIRASDIRPGTPEAAARVAEVLASADATIARRKYFAPTPRIKIFTDDQLVTLPDPVWDWDQVIARNSLVQIFGPYASFKSFFALLLLFCRSLGLDLDGKTMRRGPAFLICAEGAIGMRGRVKSLLKYMGLNRVGVHFIPEPVHLDVPEEVEDLIDAMKPRLSEGDEPWLGVDTKTRCSIGDENKTPDVQAFVRGCDRIRQATGATVIVMHHPGWQNQERGRGGYDFDASCDTILRLERDDDQITVTCTKQKDGPMPNPMTFESVPVLGSLVLKSVEPGKGPMTQTERSCLAAVPRVEDNAKGLTLAEVITAAEVAKTTAHRSLNALVIRGYVNRRQNGGRLKFFRTDAGHGALVPQFQERPA